MTRTTDLLTAILTGIAAAATTAALWYVTGNPIPNDIPTLTDLATAVTAPDDGRVFLTTLSWAGWIAWAAALIDLTLPVRNTATTEGAPS